MTKAQKSRPTHTVYVVEGEGDSAFWTKVGAAWRHEDGEGFNIELDSFPKDGKVVVRSVQERIQEAKENARDDNRREEKRSSSREDRRERDNGPRYER